MAIRQLHIKLLLTMHDRRVPAPSNPQEPKLLLTQQEPSKEPGQWPFIFATGLLLHNTP